MIKHILLDSSPLSLLSLPAASITELDGLKLLFRYLPLNTAAMVRAAELWAQSRNSGIQTDHPLKLDIDVILAPQTVTLAVPQSDVIVATANVGRLSRFVNAGLWSNIAP